MQDDDILKRIKAETQYVPDAGFTEKVLTSLPQPRRYRRGVIGFSWFTALILGLCLCISGGESLSLFSWQPSVFLSAATLGFLAIIGLFIFIAKEEGILDL